MLERMIGAAKLNVHTFEDVEHDTGAMGQAMLVVIIVSIATGIVSFGIAGPLGFIVGVIWGLVGWALWALITFWIGTKIFNTPETHADWGQLARATAFAQTPGILRALGIIPIAGPLIFLIASIWILVAMVIAVRTALDYQSTLRAIGVVIIGGIIYYILFAVWEILLVSITGGFGA